MIVHSLTQGSPEWLAYRAQHFNASDVPAMMGCSPYKTRAQLLREMHTGIAPDVDIATQKRFDNGHRAEALARPLAEEFIGQELYPITGSLGRLSASFDGLTLDETQGFEHKALNAELRAAFVAMDYRPSEDDAACCRLLPIHHRVQMEQQLLVSGAERILFMASEWTADGELVEEQHVWYYPDAPLRQQIVDGWAQFERDLAAYTPPEVVEPVTAAPIESLPAVAVRMDGALAVQSNLPAFGVALRAFVDRVPKRPSTDQEFADTEAACKALKRAEEALDAAEANALASLSDVEAMRRMVKDFRDLARDTRLAASKMVDRRKQEIREQAVAAARRALDLHIEVVTAEIAPMRLQPVPADFAGAIKGLRSISSMQDALDSTLAAAKIAADTQARDIRKNVQAFEALALTDDYGHLFTDLHLLVHKAADDFAAVVRSRIADHQAAEAAREQRRKAAEEAAAEATKQAQAAAAAKAPAPAEMQQYAPQPQRNLLPVHNPAAPASTAEPATLKLGDICGRLGFIVRGDFLFETLHVKPARIERGVGLYTEAQYQLICHQLQSHIGAMAELYGREVVA